VLDNRSELDCETAVNLASSGPVALSGVVGAAGTSNAMGAALPDVAHAEREARDKLPDELEAVAQTAANQLASCYLAVRAGRRGGSVVSGRCGGGRAAG
jgi:hypothetical protein